MKKKIFGFVLAAVLSASFCAGTAHAAEPSKIIITLTAWQAAPALVDADLQAFGWIGPNDEVDDFSYMYNTGTEPEAANEAYQRLVDLVNEKCFKGIPCELHGVSRGADVLVWIENRAHWPVPGLDVILHESSAGDSSAMRSPLVGDPQWAWLVGPVETFTGGPDPSVPLPTQWTRHYYNNWSFVANAMPQCYNIAALTPMTIGSELTHIPQVGRDAGQRVWYGPTGDINYEFGSGYASGADVKSCPPPQ